MSIPLVHTPNFLNPSVPSIGPGAKEFTRMLSGPHSTARCLVTASDWTYYMSNQQMMDATHLLQL